LPTVTAQRIKITERSGGARSEASGRYLRDRTTVLHHLKTRRSEQRQGEPRPSIQGDAKFAPRKKRSKRRAQEREVCTTAAHVRYRSGIEAVIELKNRLEIRLEIEAAPTAPRQHGQPPRMASQQYYRASVHANAGRSGWAANGLAFR
jgi:hypothetical protein